MQIKELKKNRNFNHDKKLEKAFTQFNQLLAALRKKELFKEMISKINKEIDTINKQQAATDKDFRKLIGKTQRRLLKTLEKDSKLVSKNHYRNTWMALGMSAFGLPIGIVMAQTLGNMAYIGIGLPIGMVIGVAVGTSMDRKAAEEGRALDFEIKY